MTDLLPGTLGSLVIAVLDLLRHLVVNSLWGSHRPQSRSTPLQQSTVVHEQVCRRRSIWLTVFVSITNPDAGLMKGVSVLAHLLCEHAHHQVRVLDAGACAGRPTAGGPWTASRSASRTLASAWTCSGTATACSTAAPSPPTPPPPASTPSSTTTTTSSVSTWR